MLRIIMIWNPYHYKFIQIRRRVIMNKFFTKLLSGVVTMAVLAASVAALPAKAASGNVIVYFKNTSNWKQVYCYTFNGSSGTGPSFPGTQMTSVGNGWYKYVYTGSKALNVIFDDNVQPTPTQTSNNDPKDLDLSKDAYWFVPTGEVASNAGANMGSGSKVSISTTAPAGFTDNTLSSSTASSKKSTSTSPSTGDNNMVPAACAAMIIAAAGVAFTISRKKVNK